MNFSYKKQESQIYLDCKLNKIEFNILFRIQQDKTMKGTIIYVTPNMTSYDLAVAMMQHEALYDTGITMLQSQLYANYQYQAYEYYRNQNEQHLIDDIINLNKKYWGEDIIEPQPIGPPQKKRLRKN